MHNNFYKKILQILTTSIFMGVFIGLLLGKAHSQENPTPALATEYTFTIEAEISAPVVMGESVDGVRQSIPITGGTVYGDNISGEVLSGGADYQVRRSDGSTLIRAIYMIKTDDGALINVINEGVIVPPSEGQSLYFRTSPKFTAPNGKYSWLNQKIFVCGIRMNPAKPNTVIIDVYTVK